SGVGTGSLKHWISICFDGLEYGDKTGGGITGEELAEVWRRIMSVRHLPQVVISVSDLQLRLQQWVNREVAVAGPATDGPDTSPEAVTPLHDAESVAPSLKRLWEDFFGIRDIQPDDDFFEIGGDSLKALTMIDRLRQHYRVDISFTEFINGPSVKEIGAYIDTALKKAATDKHRLQMHNLLKKESII
ncbi:Acyl carrier protein, partial [Chitinophaga eiseniae]